MCVKEEKKLNVWGILKVVYREKIMVLLNIRITFS